MSACTFPACRAKSVPGQGGRCAEHDGIDVDAELAFRVARQTAADLTEVCMRLGIPTPTMSHLGFAGPAHGSLMQGLQQLSMALAQVQELVLGCDARQEAILSELCRIDPMHGPAIRARVETAVRMAATKRGSDRAKPAILKPGEA